MLEIKYMYKFGELADEKACIKLQKDLLSSSIDSFYKLNEKTKIFDLYVANEKDLFPATERLRVLLAQAPPIKVPPEWVAISVLPKGIYSLLLIGLSIFVFALSKFENTKSYIDLLYISSSKSISQDFFLQILNGQIWRLLTPIFLHFSFLHLLFNMLWLKDLGKIVEFFYGDLFFIFFVIVVGVLSNVCQYYFSGPSFGGMSGVVYGLFGLIWSSKKLNPDGIFSLPKRDTLLMIGWFFICFTNIFGPIANIAHGIGLGLGVMTGSFSYKLLKTNPDVSFFKFIKYFALGVFFITFSVAYEILTLT